MSINTTSRSRTIQWYNKDWGRNRPGVMWGGHGPSDSVKCARKTSIFMNTLRTYSTNHHPPPHHHHHHHLSWLATLRIHTCTTGQQSPIWQSTIWATSTASVSVRLWSLRLPKTDFQPCDPETFCWSPILLWDATTTYFKNDCLPKHVAGLNKAITVSANHYDYYWHFTSSRKIYQITEHLDSVAAIPFLNYFTGSIKTLIE